MTTRVHIINLGPDAIEVQKLVPADGTLQPYPPSILYPSDSINEYVHSSQELKISEKKTS